MSQLPEDRPRVLVVDDEKVIRDMLADFLGMEGYQVRTAEDGASALAELSNGPFDLVISDLKMPKMGGMEFLQHFRGRGNTAPVLLASGYSSRSITPELTSGGEVAVVQKPYSPDDLLRKVRSMLDGVELAANR